MCIIIIVPVGHSLICVLRNLNQPAWVEVKFHVNLYPSIVVYSIDQNVRDFGCCCTYSAYKQTCIETIYIVMKRTNIGFDLAVYTFKC